MAHIFNVEWLQEGNSYRNTIILPIIGGGCGELMGFYYLILLFIGIVLLIVGIKKAFSGSVKKGIIPFVIGSLFTVTSIILLMPGSSDPISEFLIRIAY